jgi:class 3 adenylate cyclase/tetratricopeptide (TPR) repeat protein
VTCAACGHANRDRAKFCEECGARLEGTTETPAPAGPRPPRQLGDDVLGSRSALEGERKQLTVLFADVKGSLAMADSTEAEAWYGILDRFFQLMAQGVARFEGTLNQYAGDGIMALFGAPVAHEDHAQRACYAALYLQQQLRRYGNELRMSRGLDFSVRMGLNCGEVVVGAIGDPRFLDYTAQGPTVGLAARMEQLAEPGRIYLPGHMAKLVQGYFTLDEIGSFEVKGLTEPVRVFELTGLGPLRTRFDRSQARGLSTFVGRAREFSALDAAFEQVTAGRGRVVGVIGEPGAGKSRLCFEFAERCRARGVPVHEGHGVSHGRLLPLLPVAELLRSYFDVTEHDPSRVARNKIAGALLMLDRDLETALPVVFELLGIADAERPAVAQAGERRQRQLVDVVRRLVRSTSRPSVILVEDLHWIDPGTQAFLEATVEACLDTPTLLLVNFRPEYVASWTGRPYYTPLALEPLSGDAQRALVTELIGADPSLGTLPERLRERTRGNPFFVEEVVQSLIERGLLVGRRGAYELVDPAAAIDIPPSLHAVLAARVDRLDDADKHVLQSAAVIGKRVRESVLRAVADVEGTAVTDALHRLVAAGFLDVEALLPEAEYTFRHPLTREVAYGTQLGERRAERHRRAAHADEQAPLVGHHWEHAGEAALAARAYRRAAERAGLGHAAESLAHWGKVRELAKAAPPSRDTDDDGAAACAQLLLVGARAGSPADDIETLFTEGSELARRSDNLEARVRLLAAYGGYRMLARCDFEVARTHTDDAVRLAEKTSDRATRIMAGLLSGQVLAWGGAFAEALRTVERTLPLCGTDWDIGAELIGYSPRFAIGFYRVVSLAYLGRTADARAARDGLLAWALSTDEPFLQCSALSNAALVAALEGDEPVALGYARRAFELAEQSGLAGLRLLSHREVACALVQAERWTEALPVLERAVGLLRTFDAYRVVEPQIRAFLAETYAALGHDAAARAESVRAHDAAVHGGAHIQTEVLLSRIRVLLTLDGAAAAPEATTLLARAATLTDETGARRQAPVLAEERARIAHAAGDTAACDAALAEARQRYAALGLDRLAARVGRWRDPTRG